MIYKYFLIIISSQNLKLSTKIYSAKKKISAAFYHENIQNGKHPKMVYFCKTVKNKNVSLF